jgi:hypothetical protein
LLLFTSKTVILYTYLNVENQDIQNNHCVICFVWALHKINETRGSGKISESENDKINGQHRISLNVHDLTGQGDTVLIC